ncbi:MAG: hypothetical protein WD407_07030 [Rhodospirillales bacterium]
MLMPGCLSACALLALCAIAVAAPSCPGAASPAELTVRPVYGTITYRMGNTRGDLKRMQERHADTNRGLPGQWYPLGLTEAHFEMKLKTDVIVRSIAPRRYCAYPAAVELELGYPTFTVWVDRRYRRGTCEYQAILDHEHEHIGIYRDKLYLHVDSLRGQIARVIRRFRPIVVTSPQEAAGRVQTQISRKIRPLVDKFHRIADSANAKIDTPSSYRIIHSLCRNW